LKSLTIDTVGSFDAFNELFAADPPRFSHLEQLTLQQKTATKFLEAGVPRTVTNLTMGGFMSPVLSLSLSDLPPGLTKLKLYVKTLITPSEAPKFPNGLQHLHIAVEEPTCVFSLLPLGCETLALYRTSASGKRISDEEWRVLGQVQLKSLQVSVLQPFTAQQASWLPQTLEKLILQRIEPALKDEECISIAKELPQKLRFLEGVWPRSLTPEFTKALPRTLEIQKEVNVCPESVAFLPSQTKELHFTPGLNLSIISGFPSQLQDLTIPELTDHLASLLPHSLKCLRISEICTTLTGTMINLMPRNLRSLSFNTYSPRPFDTVASLKNLPPSIEVLTMYCTDSPPNKLTGEYPLLMPSESSLWLPSRLTKLKLSTIDLSESNMSQWFEGLPKSLVVLELVLISLSKDALGPLQHFTSLTRLFITSVRVPDGTWAQYLASLPPKLTDLSFTDLASPAVPATINNHSFLNVPKSLQRIFLPPSPSLTAQCLVHLPNIQGFFFHPSVKPEWFNTARLK
jgi:hypothetical protein